MALTLIRQIYVSTPPSPRKPRGVAFTLTLFLDARKSRLPLVEATAPHVTYKVLGRLSGFTFSPDDPLGIQGDPRFAFDKGQMPFAMPSAPRAAD